MKKMWHIYTMKCYSAIKRNEIMPFAVTWLDLEMVILSEESQTKTNASLICGILKKKVMQVNLFAEQKSSQM